jgi:phycocyanobilin:ferredoxin oxidoreductase
MEKHNIIKEHFKQIALLFEKKFGKPTSTKLPFQKEEHEWLNYFYNSPFFRHIHLEYYKTDKICVMHINAFPDPKMDIPIMGYDVIILNNKITGIFFDFTPISFLYKGLIEQLKITKQNIKSPIRELPEWADFFSENFISIVPDENEETEILANIIKLIDFYLDGLNMFYKSYNDNIKIQNNYCQGQKKNDKTRKALEGEIGNENAAKFLNQYLFPEITHD